MPTSKIFKLLSIKLSNGETHPSMNKTLN